MSIDMMIPHQLWTAPELLREYPNHGDLRGTQKGDIYSFAIVSQEIIYRKGAFYRPDISDPKVVSYLFSLHLYLTLFNFG
ncbi:unnamed protein product [Taenia asiatica]|uniref:Protein kinase domain-containing protein n=1 Tax=Taenia asiatica TaxID=60517 RepID=A0A0R3WH64_TAEAS|nr:unnamed protein product [Taenia asiatica]